MIFNENNQATSLLPVAVSRTDLIPLETVSDNGVGGDAHASDGRATVSHFDSSNHQRDSSVTDSDIITEPFHGFEQ